MLFVFKISYQFALYCFGYQPYFNSHFFFREYILNKQLIGYSIFILY